MERKGKNRSWEDHPLKRRWLLWPWSRESYSQKQPGVWNSPDQHYPSLVLLHPGILVCGLCPRLYLLIHRPVLAWATKKAAKSFNSWGQSWAEWQALCRDPQLSASEYLTQTHRWPEGSLHTCQEYAAGLLGPVWEDFQSTNPLSLGPKKMMGQRKEEELLLKCPDYPSEATLWQVLRSDD